jgi:polyisoprenoid-binding protein YceI
MAWPVAGSWPIDASQSLVTVTVRRGGPLARMGHDHVVASRTLDGFVDVEHGRAELRFRLDEMIVDEAALRREAGLDTSPTTEAIAGTRSNMLTKVLNAQTYPVVLLRAWRKEGAVVLEITLHGVKRLLDVPLQLENRNGRITATGSFRIKQSDFGITPMSVLGGALVVKDELELGFRIVARRR